MAIYGRPEDDKAPKEPAHRTIVDAVARWAGITPEALLAPKNAESVRAFHVAIYLADELRADKLEATGRAFNREHSSVIYAKERVRSLIASGALPDLAALRGRILAGDHAIETANASAQPTLDDARPTMHDAVAATSRYSGLSPSRILHDTTGRAVRARHLSIYLTNTIREESYSETATAFGIHKDTVRYAVRTIASDLSAPSFASDVQALREHLIANGPINIGLARHPPPAEVVVEVVAQLADLTGSELFAARSQEAVKARRMAMYLCNTLRGEKQSDTARAFGVDHGTVMHARLEAEARLREPEFASAVKQIGKRVHEVMGDSPAFGDLLPQDADCTQIRVRVDAVASASEAIAWGRTSKAPTPLIVAAVAQSANISQQELLYSSSIEARRARHVALYLANDMRAESLIETARAFGVDHTTVLYAQGKTKDQMNAPEFAEVISKLRDSIVSAHDGHTNAKMPTLPQLRVTTSQTLDTIVELAASHARMSSERLMSRTRDRDVIAARYLAIYLCTQKTDLSRASIANYFGRDHGIVADAVNHVTRAMASEPTFSAAVEKLIQAPAHAASSIASASQPLAIEVAMPGRQASTVSVPQRVLVPDKPLAPRSISVPTVNRHPLAVLHPNDTAIRINGERLPLGRALRSPKHSALVTDALRDIYLVDRLTELDARRVGLHAQRQDALVRAAQSEQYRMTLVSVRHAIERDREQAYAVVGTMIKSELDRSRQVPGHAIGL